LRLAAWKGMGVPGAGDATLAPVSLVDVLLTRPSDNGKLVQAVAFVGDSQLSTSWLLAAEARQRKTDQPSVALGEQSLVRQQVDESRLALHWQPEGAQWIASLAGDYESIQNPPESFALDSVDEQSLRSQQLALRWFASAQWTVNLAWSHNWVTGTHKTFMDPINFDYTVIYPAYQDSFNQADVDLTWQFAAYGMLSAGVRNATDASFQYADIDRLNPRFSNGRLAYARLKITW
jgi:hypothetical protein